MKNLKTMMMTLIMCLMTMVSFGQTDTLTYNDVSNSETRFKGKYDSYLSKDNYIYSIGDTIKISTPSGINGKFVYIQKMDVAGNVYVVGAEATNTYCIVKNIRVGGTKRSGWKVSFQTKGFTFVDNYFLYIEDAILSGEVKSSGLTSDEALSELKKYKDKLDLGLITQEEFDAKKSELSKYVK